MTDFLPFTRPLIDEQTIEDVCSVLRSGWLTTGPRCRDFEAALSARAGGRPVRVANSATAALEFALRIAGIGPGDEVLLPSLTWVATANVVLQVGAIPVFVDVDPNTRLMDLALAAQQVTPRTRAIMPVDLAGFPVDRDAVYALARQHGLRVIEDAAQSQGARWKGKEIGVEGDLIAFSFHPNKNMTSGEGGCLVMNSEDEARLFEKYRLQGVTRFADATYDCDLLGGKANLTDIAAAIGLGQLRQLDETNQRRADLVRQYFSQLTLWAKTHGIGLPPADFEHGNWHMFQIVLPAHMPEARPALIEALKSRGIGTGVHYPAVHQTSLFRERAPQTLPLPHTERVAAGILTLPLFPAMQDSDIRRVCEALQQSWKDIMQRG